MMELLNDIEICCNRCGRTLTIDKNEIDFYTTSYDHGENGMGDEIEYSFEEEVECCHCGYNIGVRILGSEYPVEAFNYEDSEIVGGKFIIPPHMGIVYYDEDFDEDFAYQVFDRIQELIISISDDAELIYDISSREFEEVIERVFQDNGFETKLTKQTRDGGKDIIATKLIMGKPIVYYIECKQYGRKNAVSVDIVRSLFGVQTSDKINKTILVTTGHITSETKQFVEEQNELMSIIDVEEILDLIHKSAERY